MLFIVKSRIKPSLLRFTLLRGTLIAAMGALLIVSAGVLLPLFLLSVFGLPVLLMGFALIAFGLMPYRRLAKLELFPYEIGQEKEMLLFFRHKKVLFKLPIDGINKIDFVEKGRLYGFGLRLKRPMKEKIILCDERFDPSTFVSVIEGYDFFLPYFTRRSLDELKEVLEEEELIPVGSLI